MKRTAATVVIGAMFGLSAACTGILPGAAVTPAFADEPVDPSGTWLVRDCNARIRIEHCPRPHDKICGYIVWPKAPGGADENNPDETKRSRALLSMQMLLGLEPEGTAYSGKIYNAENGKTYDAHITREDPSRLTLKGCVLKYLCQPQTWNKVDDVESGQLSGPTDGPDGHQRGMGAGQDACPQGQALTGSWQISQTQLGHQLLD